MSNKKLSLAFLLAVIIGIFLINLASQPAKSGRSDGAMQSSSNEMDSIPQIQDAQGTPSSHEKPYTNSNNRTAGNAAGRQNSQSAKHSSSGNNNDHEPKAADYRINGLALTEDGHSLAFATVEISEFPEALFSHQALELLRNSPEESNAKVIASDQTDSKGFFDIEVGQAGRYLIHVHSPGRSSALEGPIQLTPSHPESTIAITLSKALAIAGKLLPSKDGDSAAGVSIRLLDKMTSTTRSFHGQSTTTAADGSFRFDGLEAKNYIVVVQAKGAAGFIQSRIKAPNENLKIQLQSGKQIKGMVENQAGDPIAGALITAMNRSSFAQTRSEEDGSYEIKLEGQDADFLVRHDDYSVYQQRIQLRNSVSEAGETDDNYKIVMNEGSSIEAFIVDPSGQPIPNALVGSIQNSWLKGDIHTTYSDEEGRFEIHGLRPSESFQLLAKVPGLVPSLNQLSPNSFSSVADGKAHKVQLQAAAQLSAVVRSASGQLADYAWVRLHPMGSDLNIRAIQWLRGEQTTSTNANGEFHFADLVPGRYRLEVLHDSFADHWSEIQVPASGIQEIIMTPAAKLDIQIETASGQAPEGALVYAQYSGSPRVRPGPNNTYNGGVRFRAQSDGKLLIEALPAGNISIYVVAPPYFAIPWSGTLQAGEEASIVIHLEEPVAHSVVVELEGSASSPLPANTRVTLQPASSSRNIMMAGNQNPSISALTDANGIARFATLAPGRYQVSASTVISSAIYHGARTIEVSSNQTESILELEELEEGHMPGFPRGG